MPNPQPRQSGGAVGECGASGKPSTPFQWPPRLGSTCLSGFLPISPRFQPGVGNPKPRQSGGATHEVNHLGNDIFIAENAPMAQSICG